LGGDKGRVRCGDLPWQMRSTAGTKYLSQTTASAANKYRAIITCITTAPSCLCLSVKRSLGKSSMAGGVQFSPVAAETHSVSSIKCLLQEARQYLQIFHGYPFLCPCYLILLHNDKYVIVFARKPPFKIHGAFSTYVKVSP